jgi:hypothetical protein
MTVLISPWRQLLPGIEHAAGMADQAFDGSGPRDQRAQMVRIALSLSGLRFFTTPHDPKSLYQTRNSTIFDFMAAHPNVRLAINAGLAASDKDGNASLFGLAKSEGKLVCDPTIPAPQPGPISEPQPPDVRDAADMGTVTLTITQQNQASFHILNAASPTWSPPNSSLIEKSPWPSVHTAVSGSPNAWGSWPPQRFVRALQPGKAMTLENGNNNGGGPDDTFVAGRTAVGLDAGAHHLFLLTIDGIENANPPYGATFYDTAEWLRLAGASDGINVDGGGSSAMAVKVNGATSLMNVPHGDEHTAYLQRANAQFFGVILPQQSGAA